MSSARAAAPRVPRTVQDIRAMRSMPTGAGPASEPDTYAKLSQLARERQHLLAEQQLWQRKLQRIASRLAEVDAQMLRLRRDVPEARAARQPAPPGQAYREMEFRY
jgi:hypothetical protein